MSGLVNVSKIFVGLSKLHARCFDDASFLYWVLAFHPVDVGLDTVAGSLF